MFLGFHLGVRREMRFVSMLRLTILLFRVNNIPTRTKSLCTSKPKEKRTRHKKLLTYNPICRHIKNIPLFTT